MRRRYPSPIALSVLFLLIPAVSLLASEPAPPRPDGWLGIYYSTVDSLPMVEEQAGGVAALRGATAGLVVDAVFPHSAAEKGGLMAGDVLVGLGGEPFTCPRDSVQALFRRKIEGMVGEAKRMRVVRNAVTRTLRVDGAAVDPLEAEPFWLGARAFSESLASGSALAATASRRQEVLDLDIVLGERPEAKWPPAEAVALPEHVKESDFAPLARRLIDRAGVRDDCDDLFGRLAALHDHADPFRHPAVVLAHRNPFMLEDIVTWGLWAITDTGRAKYGIEPFDYRDNLLESNLVQSRAGREQGLELIHADQGSLNAFNMPKEERRDLPPNEKLETYLKWIESRLEEMAVTHDSAFAAWTPEERAFVEREMWGLPEAFDGEVYIHFDEDRARFANNERLIELAAKVDRELLRRQFGLALNLARSRIPRHQDILSDIFADSLDKEYLVDRETPYGRIVVAGTGDNWHRDRDVAFLIDLGGNDLYTGNAGGSRGFELPTSICIDLGGNDAYESTERGAQGAGILGVGILVDTGLEADSARGDDSYVGVEWCQGGGYFGIGALDDRFGNDTYRGRVYCQGVGLFGRGYVSDLEGNDRYEGASKVQGVGLAGGIGVIRELRGDDEYYAKGLHPTGYGTSGIFDSWSQGCGMGFRTLASGGIGIIYDGDGDDRMEAGNFSQGGGYYYGMGIVVADEKSKRPPGSTTCARIPENDVYIGSRYNQGFSAHQAVGVFIDRCGDDFYTTRHGVAQGLAWDESVTLFLDRGGDDIYEGGKFFSQGASAHNSITFFLDEHGDDTYKYEPGPARAGPNTYHGGTSLSLFMDLSQRLGDPRQRPRRENDLYSASHAANDTILCKPEHGFFLDYGWSIHSIIEDKAWEQIKSAE